MARPELAKQEGKELFADGAHGSKRWEEVFFRTNGATAGRAQMSSDLGLVGDTGGDAG